MNIIYLSSSCSNAKFDLFQKQEIIQELPQAQKYHKLLLHGLVKNGVDNIVAITAIPTNRRNTKKIFFFLDEEKIGKIEYKYLGFLNLVLFRQLNLFLGAKKQIRKAIKRLDKDCIIVCDILNQSIARAALKMGKKYHIPVVGIVTDVPGHRANSNKKMGLSIRRRLGAFIEQRNLKMAKEFDAYLFLTLAMNTVVNVKDKPYIVLEGHSDSGMQLEKNTQENKTHPKVLMYAGGVHREYGLELLVKAFILGAFDGWSLDIYGDGNYKEELLDLVKKHKNINYFGVCSNKEIIEKQIKATLLVNPRPTNEEFVKYSFPSKTLEAMASGTPLLTTRLPGIPEEYYEYLYFFDGETEQDFYKKLKEIFMYSNIELHQKGMNAKGFALTKKNNVVQAKKFYGFLEKLLKDYYGSFENSK